MLTTEELYALIARLCSLLKESMDIVQAQSALLIQHEIYTENGSLEERTERLKEAVTREEAISWP